MTHGSLFSGIGGFDLAAYLAGWTNIFQVEWNVFCQKILKKNFPDARIYSDIRDFDGTAWRGKVDVISGGFPCQPYSSAGKRLGNDDDRALWPEMLRVIREVAPAWVVGENVAGILTMDGGRVFAGILADLENEGYCTETYLIPAVGVGAPHERYRVWIVAHRDNLYGAVSEQPPGRRFENKKPDTAGENFGATSDAGSGRRNRRADNEGEWQASRIGSYFDDSRTYADANLQRCEQLQSPCQPSWQGFNARRLDATWAEHWYEVATRICRVDDGVPAWLDGTGNLPTKAQKKAAGKGHRLEALGNAVVPQLVWRIFDAINQFEAKAK